MHELHIYPAKHHITCMQRYFMETPGPVDACIYLIDMKTNCIIISNILRYVNAISINICTNMEKAVSVKSLLGAVCCCLWGYEDLSNLSLLRGGEVRVWVWVWVWVQGCVETDKVEIQCAVLAFFFFSFFLNIQGLSLTGGLWCLLASVLS